jgi:hypothetical protein
MLIAASKAIMDPSKNALMRLPKTVRFQLMVVLSCLWSVIFCVSAGLIVWLPGYVFAHAVLLAIGIFGTSWAFKSAGKRLPEIPKANL